MIILYHCSGARSFRALWALEELSVPYQLELLPFPPRTRAPGFLEINPLGTVPVLLDGATRITESAAIIEYLAERHGATSLAVACNEPGYGAYLNYLHLGEATLTFPQTLYLRYAMFEPDDRRVPQVAEDYVQWFLARLDAVSQMLGEADYVAADRFTMADISVAYALRLAEHIGLADRFPSSITAYWERVSTRDAYRRAAAAEGRG